MSNYTSSIVSKYGDTARVREDVKMLREIADRQSSLLLIDVIAEICGEVANARGLTTVERNRLIDDYTSELRNAIAERV